MIKNKYLLIFFMGWVVAFSGCETYEQDVYAPRYVVQAYLTALDPLPRISLSTDAPLNSVYDLKERAVKGANMEVQLLNAEGKIEATYKYVDDPDSVSMYKPLDTRSVVLPKRTYALKITFPNKTDIVSATTVVPDTFTVKKVNAKTFADQALPQPTFTYSPSENVRGQSYFIASIHALDAQKENLVPFWNPETAAFPDIKDGKRKAPNPYSSPILNEKNYSQSANGDVTIPLPWITIVYYGRNVVTTQAMDDNIYDFFRSQSVQLGGGTLSPGEIPNAITGIKGGTGIFGSYAKASAEIVVSR